MKSALFVLLAASFVAAAVPAGFSRESKKETAVTAAATSPSTRPIALLVDGEIANPATLSEADLAKLPQIEINAIDKDGKQATFAGVSLRAILLDAGGPIGNEQLRGKNLELVVVAEAIDGYKVVFALADFDDDFADRNILLATRRNGVPLDAKSGPLRLVVPGDATPARWIRMLTAIHVVRVMP